MRVFLLLFACLFLSGCGAAGPVWETVDDVPPVQAVANWREEAYVIQVAVPEDMDLTLSSEGCTVYETEDGVHALKTTVFLSSDLDSAVRQLSGYNADQLLLVETARFGLPEYHFAWYDEEEARLHQADLVMDGETCYAVVCSRAEAAGEAGDQRMRPVFASFGLSFPEGV